MAATRPNPDHGRAECPPTDPQRCAAAIRPGGLPLVRALAIAAALSAVAACGTPRSPAPASADGGILPGPPAARTKPAPALPPALPGKAETAEPADQARPPAEADSSPVAERAIDPESTVFFPAGGAEVDESGRVLLQRHAQRLKQAPDLAVTLVGHTDPQGSRSYNLALAQARIDSVAAILRAAGVPSYRIRRANPGHRASGRDCATPACREAMRRVELVYE